MGAAAVVAAAGLDATRAGAGTVNRWIAAACVARAGLEAAAGAAGVCPNDDPNTAQASAAAEAVETAILCLCGPKADTDSRNEDTRNLPTAARHAEAADRFRAAVTDRADRVLQVRAGRRFAPFDSESPRRWYTRRGGAPEAVPNPGRVGRSEPRRVGPDDSTMPDPEINLKSFSCGVNHTKATRCPGTMTRRRGDAGHGDDRKHARGPRSDASGALDK